MEYVYAVLLMLVTAFAFVATGMFIEKKNNVIATISFVLGACMMYLLYSTQGFLDIIWP